jgi:hypothetical protein
MTYLLLLHKAGARTPSDALRKCVTIHYIRQLKNLEVDWELIFLSLVCHNDILLQLLLIYTAAEYLAQSHFSFCTSYDLFLTFRQETCEDSMYDSADVTNICAFVSDLLNIYQD